MNDDGVPIFSIHWSVVDGPVADRLSGPGRVLCALWPAPVNPDACFEEAGFSDFADSDDAWDTEADDLLHRLVDALSAYGPPSLASEPVRGRRWIDRLVRREPPPVDLVEQLLLATHWDSLPPCRVAFGASGLVTLVTGAGHRVYWFTLPADDATGLAGFVARLAGPHPVTRTALVWTKLI